MKMVIVHENLLVHLNFYQVNLVVNLKHIMRKKTYGKHYHINFLLDMGIIYESTLIQVINTSL
jgi:hypothetical protein